MPPRPRAPRQRTPHRWRLHELTIRYTPIPARTIAPQADRPVLDDSHKVCRLIAPLYSRLAHEHAGVLGLDARFRPIAHRVISRGSHAVTLMSPRDVLQAAILMDAASVILIHNHPSGDPTPSPDDRSIYLRIRSACELAQIPCLDGIILAPPLAYSLQADAPIVY